MLEVYRGLLTWCLNKTKWVKIRANRKWGHMRLRLNPTNLGLRWRLVSQGLGRSSPCELVLLSLVWVDCDITLWLTFFFFFFYLAGHTTFRTCCCETYNTEQCRTIKSYYISLLLLVWIEVCSMYIVCMQYNGGFHYSKNYLVLGNSINHRTKDNHRTVIHR